MHETPAEDGPAALGRPIVLPTMSRSRAIPPRFAFAPGRTPHPDRVGGPHAPAIDAAGVRMADAVAAEDARETAEAGLEAIRLGADLHDGGWWWEAHEAWEIPWRARARDDPRSRLVQALVQDAAAWLQLERGRPTGVRRLIERAGRNRNVAIADAPGFRRWLGLDHLDRQREVEAYADRCRRGRAHDAGTFPRLPPSFPAAAVP